MDVEKYREIKKKGINKGSYKAYIHESVLLFKKGWSRKKIVDHIIEQSKLSHEVVYYIIVTQASQIISDEYINKGESLIGLHLERYNRDIQSLQEKTYDHINDYSKQLQAKIADKFELLQLLHQKEKFLQLHSKTTVVKLNNSKTKSNRFDFKKLTHSNKIEMLKLLEKCKGTVEISGVKLSSYSNQEIEEAEIIEETSSTTVNVDKIQTITHTEVITTTPAVNLEQVTEKIRQALLKKAQEDFKQKGGKV